MISSTHRSQTGTMPRARAAAEAAGNGSGNPTRFRGVRKRPWGRFVAEIRDPWKKTKVWLGTFDSAEAAARAYDAAAVGLLGPAAKTNFPSHHHLPLTQRPASSNLSSTVESSSGPRAPDAAIRRRRPVRVLLDLDDRHSDCGSSSSVVDDGEILSTGFRQLLPFDLNLPPPDDEPSYIPLLRF